MLLHPRPVACALALVTALATTAARAALAGPSRPDAELDRRATGLQEEGEQARKANDPVRAAERFRAAAKAYFDAADALAGASADDLEFRADHVASALRLYLAAHREVPLAAEAVRSSLSKAETVLAELDGKVPEEALAPIRQAMVALQELASAASEPHELPGPEPEQGPVEVAPPQPPRGLQAGLGVSAALMGVSAALLGVGYYRLDGARDDVLAAAEQARMSYPTEFPEAARENLCTSAVRGDTRYGLAGPCADFTSGRNLVIGGAVALGTTAASTVVFAVLYARARRHLHTKTSMLRLSTAFAAPTRGGVMLGGVWSF